MQESVGKAFFGAMKAGVKWRQTDSNSTVPPGTLNNTTTRSLACQNFRYFPAYCNISWSVALTNRRAGCLDSYVNMANAPVRHFSCPVSLTTYKLAQGLQRWLVSFLLLEPTRLNVLMLATFLYQNQLPGSQMRNEDKTMRQQRHDARRGHKKCVVLWHIR